MNINTKAALLATVIMVASSLAWSQDKYQPEIPQAIAAKVQAARALRLSNEPARALAMLEPIRATHPQYFLARYNLGLTYQALNRNTEAIQELEAAKQLNLELKLGEPTVYNSLGWLYLSVRNYEAAAAQFELARKPENFKMLSASSQRKVLNNAAIASSYLNKPAQAAQFYSQAEQKKSISTAEP